LKSVALGFEEVAFALAVNSDPFDDIPRGCRMTVFYDAQLGAYHALIFAYYRRICQYPVNGQLADFEQIAVNQLPYLMRRLA
jgi:hypothetical protein